NSIEKRPLSIILIEGQTDKVGSEQSKETLSKLRAQKIYTLLINEGISEKNIKYKYFGSSRPKANNLTAKNRKLNRRVEITILQ
ncbi:MAG: OmpA family protein, partial [Vicingaceae bacterium]